MVEGHNSIEKAREGVVATCPRLLLISERGHCHHTLRRPSSSTLSRITKAVSSFGTLLVFGLLDGDDGDDDGEKMSRKAKHYLSVDKTSEKKRVSDT